jgi:hypothetical protein
MHKKSEYIEAFTRVGDILWSARKEVEGVVRGICRMIAEDAGERLDELAREHKFTYAIEPYREAEDPAEIVPCVYVEGDSIAYAVVWETLREMFPDLVDYSRLKVLHVPRRGRGG